MEITQIILIIAGIVVAFMVMKLVTKTLFRLILIVVLVVGCIFGYQALTGANMIDWASQTYCNKTSGSTIDFSQDIVDPIKCECFVKPILDDLNSRFSEDEMEALKKDPLKGNLEFIGARDQQEEIIKNCLAAKGAEGLWKELFNDMLNIFGGNTE